MIEFPFRIGPGTFGHFESVADTSMNDDVHTLDGVGEYYGMVFNVNKTQPINDIGFYLAAVSGTSSFWSARLMTISSTGAVGTTNYGGSSGTVFQITDLVKGWNWKALSTPATGTVGEFAMAQLVNISGASASDYILASEFSVVPSRSPRVRRTSSNLQQHPVWAVRYSDDTAQGFPASSFANKALATGSSPSEMGMKFTVPTSMRCDGARIWANFDASAACNILLYQEGNIIRATQIPDSDYVLGTLTFDEPIEVYWSPVDLEINTNYRMTVQSKVGTTTLYEFTLVTGTYRHIYPGGELFSETYRTASGSFTDDEQKFLWMDLHMSHIASGTAGTTTTIITGEGAHAWAY